MDIKNNLQDMLMMVISLVFIAIILPIGLVYIINIGSVEVGFTWVSDNTTYTNITLNQLGADTVIALISTLIPITIAIGIIINYLRSAMR